MKLNPVLVTRCFLSAASVLVALPLCCFAQGKPVTITRGDTNFYLVDLAAFMGKRLEDYKPNQSWAAPPRGLQTLGGVPFFIEGKLELTGMGPARDGRFEKSRIDAIPVGRTGQRIHVLHGTGYDDSEGSPTYKLVLHYADGQHRSQYLAYGVHFRNWYLEPKEVYSELEDPNSVVAWTGTSPDTDRVGARLRLFRTTLMNPRPDQEIKVIDLVSLFGRATPAIVALTIEKGAQNSTAASDDAEPDDSPFRAELVVRVSNSQTRAGLPGARAKLELWEDRKKIAFGEYAGDGQGRIVIAYPPRRIVSMNLQIAASGHSSKLVAVPRSDDGEFAREVTVTLNPSPALRSP